MKKKSNTINEPTCIINILILEYDKENFIERNKN